MRLRYNLAAEGSNPVDVTTLRPGDRIRTVDGAIAQVLKESEDGEWILVRYVEAPGNGRLVGTEDLCHEDEVEEVVQAASTNH